MAPVKDYTTVASLAPTHSKHTGSTLLCWQWFLLASTLQRLGLKLPASKMQCLSCWTNAPPWPLTPLYLMANDQQQQFRVRERGWGTTRTTGFALRSDVCGCPGSHTHTHIHRLWSSLLFAPLWQPNFDHILLTKILQQCRRRSPQFLAWPKRMQLILAKGQLHLTAIMYCKYGFAWGFRLRSRLHMPQGCGAK